MQERLCLYTWSHPVALVRGRSLRSQCPHSRPQPCHRPHFSGAEGQGPLGAEAHAGLLGGSHTSRGVPSDDGGYGAGVNTTTLPPGDRHGFIAEYTLIKMCAVYFCHRWWKPGNPGSRIASVCPSCEEVPRRVAEMADTPLTALEAGRSRIGAGPCGSW